MVNIRYQLLCLFFLFGAGMSAQEFDRTGLLRTSLTIAPGLQVNTGISMIYLHGFLEYFPEEKVSIRGNGYYCVDSWAEDSRIAMNHTLSFGCMYHPVPGRIDPYAGIEPALLFVKIRNDRQTFVAVPPVAGVVPGMGLTAGCSYFVSRYFNFFAQGTYMVAARFQETYVPISVSDVRISAGLGFSLPVK